MVKTFEEFIKSNQGKNIGFGMLTANKCIVYAKKYLCKILDGDIKIDELKPNLMLKFDDDDAIPFEVISLSLPNDEKFKIFFVGNKGDGHSALINLAFKESPLKITNLPTNWKYNKNLSEIINSMSFSYGGRLWEKSKIVVLKSYKDFKESIGVISRMLEINHIDISDYTLLVCEDNNDIDEKYWGDIIAYKVNDIVSNISKISLPINTNILHHKYDVKTKKLLYGNGKEEMTLAQYNSLLKQENISK
ncbi:MAG: hypothetical protein HDS91_05850 [Bacteroidales bacterium]|nr:hypothetical protein [Bacteroidales bacterium]